MLAVVEDPSGDAISTDHYRYYTPGETGADPFVDGIKYAVTGAQYDELLAAAGGTLSDVIAASDSLVAEYAQNDFAYDSGCVATQSVAGFGSSSTSGGDGTYTFTYTSSTANSAGVNSWQMKTVVTQPDGNVNITYTNAYGNVMLNIYEDTTTSQQWATYYKYDASGRCILMAQPSAVTGYDDSYADLVN